ncbi:MAG: bifunctional glutamate N-acetyltransferase/amino-acid acetyltransferase ArgJ [Lachnospiraceae bacterium]|nr:bifunctional glutamate N-acetyltransferase/amino-acid acetyltransferase ArgJ [Lachnospiraceae bacterium]
MKQFEDYKYIDGGVCAAEGFSANGINAGINPDKSKNDLGAIASISPCKTACVYTQNKVKGAPIIVTKENLQKSNNISQAVIVNSKNANTCNANGIEIAEQSCELLAKYLGIPAEYVIVASTGVIGQPMSIEPFKNGMEELTYGLSKDGNRKAVNAIMTTDTKEKEVAVEFEIEGRRVHMGGMGKGSGMIHPNMATTLNFITTDVNISAELLQKAVDELVQITYNCLTIDGDTSTNDMLSVMANGMAGNKEITVENGDYKKVKQALYIVMMNLTRMLAADGEGANKLIEVNCVNAPTLEIAKAVAKSVAGSSLVKCAVNGCDANWGRILCAIGYTDAEFDISVLDVSYSSANGTVSVFENGAGVDFSEELATNILSAEEVYINIDMHQGSEKITAWGCDLTHEYVSINADYRS